MTNTGRYEFVDCMRLALFGDGCSAAVLTAEDVKPGDNKWVIEGNQYFSNQTSITIKEARFLEILVFKNNELVYMPKYLCLSTLITSRPPQTDSLPGICDLDSKYACQITGNPDF